LGPQAEVQLAVRRVGKDRQTAVTLGNVEEAPLRWYREAYAHGDHGISGGSMGGGDSILEQALDDLRRQIRSLQQQVNAMQGGAGQAVHQPQGNPREAGRDGQAQPPAGAGQERNQSRRGSRAARALRRRRAMSKGGTRRTCNKPCRPRTHNRRSPPQTVRSTWSLSGGTIRRRGTTVIMATGTVEVTTETALRIMATDTSPITVVPTMETITTSTKVGPTTAAVGAATDLVGESELVRT
jgi:hypothetical protein